MARHLATLALVALMACDDQPYDVGLREPVRVRGGVFHEGAFPEDEAATTPRVTNAGGVGGYVTRGQAAFTYSGVASTDTYAVAVGFADLGAGYWTLPVGGPDVTQDDQLTFQFTADFGRALPYGTQTLSFAAIDGEGRPGPRYDTSLCVLPEVANQNLAACDPATQPQFAVISLTWDTDVDLDLIVVAPNGKIVSSKLPSTALLDADGRIASTTLNDPATGTLVRDSNAGCAIDGIRRESLVFPGAPPAGDYRIYASLHAACGAPIVHFRATLFLRTDGGPDTDAGPATIEETLLAVGELLPLQVTRPDTLGIYVTTVTLP